MKSSLNDVTKYTCIKYLFAVNVNELCLIIVYHQSQPKFEFENVD